MNDRGTLQSFAGRFSLEAASALDVNDDRQFI
jgi:hypothetical protein